MPAEPSETCWTLILGAASGQGEARAQFASRYAGVIKAYLRARWRDNRLIDAVPDAVQDVLLETFKVGGLLDKVQPGLPGGFRAFLFGATRIVARRFEEGRHKGNEIALPSALELDGGVAVDPQLSKVFDRAWAASLMKQASEKQALVSNGIPDRERRLELLRLRFQEELPIREIAKQWGWPPKRVHKWYSLARSEFHAALLLVLDEHQPGSQEELESRARGLLSALA